MQDDCRSGLQDEDGWLNGSEIPGAQGPGLALGNMAPQDVGHYQMRVWDERGREVWSQAAAVETGPVAEVLGAGSGTEWVEVGAFTNQVTGQIESVVDSTVGDLPAGFYRVREDR